MRGARETVAKALALECMRAAKAQERGCYVFAFAGPQEVGQVAGFHGGWVVQQPCIRPATVDANGVRCVCPWASGDWVGSSLRAGGGVQSQCHE